MLGAEGDAQLIGMTLGGRWRIQKRLGAGGMGDVFEGEDLSQEDPIGKVALKVISPARLLGLDEPTKRKLCVRFEREAAALKSLLHPFTVRCFAHGATEDGMPWMVLELLEGRTVGWHIRRHGRIEPAPRVAQIARQAALSLAEAHALGIIHRDVKPDNMHIQGAGEVDWVRLFDFGVARLEGLSGVKVTAMGATVGTTQYMAPEQAKADSSLTHAVDFYALGVSVYEMLTGQLPYLGASDMDVLAQHVHAALPELELADSVLGGTASAQAWRSVIHALMAKSPQDRLSDGIEVARRFLELAEPGDLTTSEAGLADVVAQTEGQGASAVSTPPGPQDSSHQDLLVPSDATAHIAGRRRLFVGLVVAASILFGLGYLLTL